MLHTRKGGKKTFSFEIECSFERKHKDIRRHGGGGEGICMRERFWLCLLFQKKSFMPVNPCRPPSSTSNPQNARFYLENKTETINHVSSCAMKNKLETEKEAEREWGGRRKNCLPLFFNKKLRTSRGSILNSLRKRVEKGFARRSLEIYRHGVMAR